MDRNALLIAGAVGLAAQLIMIVAGHYVPVVRDKGLMIGGLIIALVTGLIYARRARAPTWPSAVLDGGLAAGFGAFLAISASVALKDTPAMVVIVGTLSSIVAGMIGGAAGKLWR